MSSTLNFCAIISNRKHGRTFYFNLLYKELVKQLIFSSFICCNYGHFSREILLAKMRGRCHCTNHTEKSQEDDFSETHPNRL
jgi:S-adenosylhomocysteine hydrolase